MELNSQNFFFWYSFKNMFSIVFLFFSILSKMRSDKEWTILLSEAVGDISEPI